MKSLLIMFLMVFGLNALSQEKTTKEEKTPKFKTVKIKTSAVCGMCETTIENGLTKVKGVKNSQLNVKSKIVTVKYSPKKTDPEKIRKAITLIGYDADDMPADEKAYENLHYCCKKDWKE